MSAKMSDKFGVTDGVEDGVDDSGITKDKLRGCAQGVAGTAAASGNLHDVYKVFEAGFWSEIGHVRVAFGALDVESFSVRYKFL